MIFDNIRNIATYKELKNIYMALNEFSKITEDNFPDKPIVLIENKLFINPVSFNSKYEADCTYEAHKKYIDIHYIISGSEKIATADVRDLKEVRAYSPESDIYFLEGKENGFYTLLPGQFMVCFPEDAHKVAIAPDKPAQVKKLVAKIAV